MMTAEQFIGHFTSSGKPVRNLSRIRLLLEELDNPQEKLRVVHVAGTNGKGSVTAYVAAAAAAAGFRVGTLTSPYIRRYNDRIQINGEEIPDEVLERICAQVQKAEVPSGCSQFEITFAIGLLWFVEEKCDLVVLETGIGGLLDATNIVRSPLVCAITSVSYDHMALLGETLTEIARHKAGIIKHGCPVVLSPDNSMDVVCLVQEIARSKQAQLSIPSQLDCRILEETPYFTRFSYHSMEYRLQMPGRHQVYNALTAIEVIRMLGMHGYLITARMAKEAFEQVRVPARTEFLGTTPPILLDGAHNTAGILALTDLIRLWRKENDKPVHALCGMMAAKDYRSACGILSKCIDDVICVDDFAAAALPAETLAACFDEDVPTRTAQLESGLEALAKQVQADGGLGVICGSLYLAAAVGKGRLNRR